MFNNFKNLFEKEEIKNARKALEVDPENPKLIGVFADILAQNNLHREAIQELEKIFKKSPNDIVAMDKVAEYSLQISDFKKAKENLFKILTIAPKEPLALAKLRIITEVSVDVELVIEVLKKLIEVDPDDEVSGERYATLLVKNGEFVAAIKEYERLEKNYKFSRIYHNLVDLYMKTGQPNKALSTLETLFQLGFITNEELKIMGMLYSQTGYFEEANEIFRILTEVFPDDEFDIRNEMAINFIRKKDYQEASKMCKGLILAHPEYHDYKFTLVKALDGLKDYDFAIAFLKEFLTEPISKKIEARIKKELADTFLKSALYKQSQGVSLSEVHEILSNGLYYNPQNHEIYYALSLLNLETKNYDDAINNIKSAIKLDEMNPSYTFVLANIYKARDNKALYENYKNQTIKLDPSYKEKFEENN